MRWFGAVLVAVVIAVASFVLLLVMTFPPQSSPKEPKLQMGYFVPKSQKSSDPSRPRLQIPQAPTEQQVETPPLQQPPLASSPSQTAPLNLVVPKLSGTISVAPPSLQGLTTKVSRPSQPLVAQTEPIALTEASRAVAAQGANGGPAAEGSNSEVTPLNNILPVYPDSARRRGLEGYVQLAFTITADGRVENLRVVESSPARVFDRAARRAASRWRFAPRQVNGQPVAREAVKRLEFKLEKRGR